MSDEISAIDKAIAAATARKAAKNGGVSTATGEKLPKAPKEPKPAKEPSKRTRVSDEEKAARQAAKDAARATRKAEREATRAAKKLAKASDKKTPHMAKVEAAAAKLPALTDEAQVAFNDITANFSAAMVSAIAAHMQHFNRARATERALTQVIKAGNTVRIVSGDPRFIGQVGEVAKAQRIRCYVSVPGVNKPVYCFTSDCELVAADQVAEAV